MLSEKLTAEEHAMTSATERLGRGESLAKVVFGLVEDYKLSTQQAFTILMQVYGSLRQQGEVQTRIAIPELPGAPAISNIAIETDLSTVDPDALGLDWLDDIDIKLIDAIEMAKFYKTQGERLRDFADEALEAWRNEALEGLNNGKTVQEVAEWLFDTYEDVSEEEMYAVAALANKYRHELAREVAETLPALTFFESIALPLAIERGWKVVPLFPKVKKVHTTLVPSPLQMATKDPLKIHEWALKEPGANVGVYAEQIEGGLLFLDKDGAISLREKYERETGRKFPQTLLVRSSIVDDGKGNIISKGHWYFHQTPRTLMLGKDGGKTNIAENTTNGLFSLRIQNQSESGKTTGLEWALAAAKWVLNTADVHAESLFRYKSETTFIRSFTTEGTQKRDPKGEVKSGRPGHPSQFLHIKEGNLVANCSDYFGAVFSMLTNLYDQTEAGTESMTNGDFTAVGIKASTVMCFTPSDYKSTFGGKGTIGGGGLNRWGVVNPPEDHSYDDRDWQGLDESEYQGVSTQFTTRVIELRKGESIVLTEEPEAAKIRLGVKAVLKKAGKVGKRLLDYFMREQVAQAAMSVDGRFVMTAGQASYAKAWVEAQLQCRINCWPGDSDNKIEDMEHSIRKAVNGHFVSETKLKDVCNFYREGSGGWFVFNAARSNAVSSGAIKLTGMTQKGVRAYCPGACAEHQAIKEQSPSKK